MARLHWGNEKVDPNDIVDLYAQMIREIPKPLEAWAAVEGGRIHFYTILHQNFDAERMIYAAERAVLKRFGPEYVTFDVFPDTFSIKEHAKDAFELLQVA